jgi:acetyltransferase-like isoleucine patch superfamily enzyme
MTLNRLRATVVWFFKKPHYFIISKFLEFLAGELLKRYTVYGDKSRLRIAPTAVVNNALFNTVSGRIEIEDYVFFGHNVCVLTGTHDYKKFGLERQVSCPNSGRDVVIKKGVWVSSNATILGPCIIGENSVIGACCLIYKDVPPNTLCISGSPLVLKEIRQEK